MIPRPAANAASVTLGAVALLLFAVLTQRHVGESSFLADQVDQLQKYEAALRLEPEGLWGPAMSGTVARAAGPFGALVFGLPVSLGLGIDAIHALTSLLLAIAAGIAFWQLARLNQAFAWIWLMVFTAMRMVWWNAAIFWVNTLLLPLGLAVLALFAAHLRRPSTAKVAGIALALLLALHVHLTALVGLPILLVAAFHARRGGSVRATHRQDGRPGTLTVLGVIAVALLPYFLAEARTGLRNTRAIFSHAESTARAEGGEGARAAVETLVLAADPMVLSPENQTRALMTGGFVALAALTVLAWRRRRPEASTIMWLVVTALAGVAVQALFFRLMARPLNGLHYAMLLAPWYAIPPAALLAAPFAGATPSAARLLSPALGVAAVLLLLFHAPARADRFAEGTTPWNYRTIVAALDMLCAGEAVQTVEGHSLRNDLTPSYDSVLRYLMKRGLSRCHYDPQAGIVIAANREASFEPSIEVDGRRYARERVLPPGLARYRLREP